MRRGLLVAIFVSLPVFGSLYAIDQIAQFQSDPTHLPVLFSAFPKDPQNYLQRASLSVFTMPDQAIADCDSALALDPNNQDAIRLKTRILIAQNKFDQAWQCNELDDHATSDYYRSRAMIEQARDKHAEAAASLEQLHKLAPNWNDYYEICTEYALAGKFDQALSSAQMRTATAGDDLARVQGWRLQARYCIALGRYKEALAAASQSIQISPEQEIPPGLMLSEPAYTYRAEAYFNLKNYKAAIVDATRAMTIQAAPISKYYRALKVRSESYEALGMTSEAAADKHKLAHIRNELLQEDI